MNAFARLAWIALLLIVSLTSMLTDRAAGQADKAAEVAAAAVTADAAQAAEAKQQQRRELQMQELMLAKSGSWIFKPGQTPRIQWRDVETVRRLGGSKPLRARWFDADLNEAAEPLPEQLPSSFSPDLTVAFPNFPGPETPPVLKEHQAEIVRLANDALVRAVLGSEQAAVLIAGLTVAESLGHPARYVESTTVGPWATVRFPAACSSSIPISSLSSRRSASGAVRGVPSGRSSFCRRSPRLYRLSNSVMAWPIASPTSM